MYILCMVMFVVCFFHIFFKKILSNILEFFYVFTNVQLLFNN